MVGDDADTDLVITVGGCDRDGVVVVAVAGTLNQVSRERFWSAMGQVLDGPGSRVVVDAVAVVNLDRAGASVLGNVAERAQDSDMPFAVGALSSRFAALISYAGLEAFSHGSVDRARQAVLERFAPGEPTRMDLLRENRDLRAAITAAESTQPAIPSCDRWPATMLPADRRGVGGGVSPAEVGTATGAHLTGADSCGGA